MTQVKGYRRRPYRVMGRIVHPGSTTTYNRRQRPSHGKKKIKAKSVYAKIDFYRDEYGQLRQERNWKIIKRG